MSSKFTPSAEELAKIFGATKEEWQEFFDLQEARIMRRYRAFDESTEPDFDADKDEEGNDE